MIFQARSLQHINQPADFVWQILSLHLTYQVRMPENGEPGVAKMDSRMKDNPRYLGLFAVVAFVLCLTNPSFAQDRGKFLTLQGISSATVAPNGTVFASITGTSRRSGTGRTADGSMELGFGLGSAEDNVGVQISTTITSLKSTFGDSGYVNLKFSRRISAGAHPTYISIEANHLANWGDAKLAKARGKIAVTTFGLARFSEGGDSYPYMLTLGAGNDLRNNGKDPGVFLGAGIGVTDSLGLSAAWTGETFDMGASVRMASVRNVSFNASVNDVFDSRNSRRVTLSVNWSLSNVFGG